MNSLSDTVMSSTSDGPIIKDPWRVMPAPFNTGNFKLEACYAGRKLALLTIRWTDLHQRNVPETLVPVTNNNIPGFWFRGQNGAIPGETIMVRSEDLNFVRNVNS